MSNTLTETPQYRSLLELQLRKEQIRNAIIKDNADMAGKWKSLFSRPKTKEKKSLSVSSLVNMGAGALDGFLLVWKLYRKFHK